jgi:alkylhydroperoxidase family enzyme
VTRIEPVPTEDLPAYFRQLVEADEAAGRDSALNGVMAHHPQFIQEYFAFRDPYLKNGVVDSRIKELARLKIARLNGCQTCSLARYESATRQGLDEACIAQLDLPVEEQTFSERERLAVEFAERMATDHFGIDDTFVDQLKTNFTPSEILELGFMIGQFIGFGRLLVALGLHQYSSVTYVPGIG